MTQSKKRVLTKSVVKKIKTLLKEGKSRSQIVKDLKIRKKTGLDWIRQVTKTRKNKRLTEIGQRARLFKKPLTINQQNMVTDLYRQGYSKEFIKKIGKNRFKKAIPDSILKPYENEHKENNLLMRRGLSKQYKRHLDAKYYRLQNAHYHKYKEDQFSIGSPSFIVYREDDAEAIQDDELLQV